MVSVYSPLAAAVTELSVLEGAIVQKGEQLAVLESMKMQTPVCAPESGVVKRWCVEAGVTIQKATLMCELVVSPSDSADSVTTQQQASHSGLVDELRQRAALSHDAQRSEKTRKRHEKGFRSARENLDDLCDTGSFIEYGQLAVAAQRQRRELDELRRNTQGDGVVTGLATINAEQFGADQSQALVIINDYSVLAGTQGYFHHKKLDRALSLAIEKKLPVVMYTEGGGGRPGDTDVLTQFAGLNVPSFARWAGLRGQVPRIAVNNGYCFAGNAALFGAADIRIATRESWIGMAGPAMIEGGGLGKFSPKEIGPMDVQSRNGVVHILAADEAEATAFARQALGYFQGRLASWECADQTSIGDVMPEDRRYAYDVRQIISQLSDANSVLELGADYGAAVISALVRIEGRPLGLIASNCGHLGGAVDAEAADKTADFIELCNAFNLPIVSLIDTPGFMVGPDSENEAAVRRMSRLFAAGAQAQVPWVAIFLRRAYGLGAMALTGGSFERPLYAASWPSGEFGAMGLEGAVRLGFKKELEAEASAEACQQLFESLLEAAYDQGKAIEAASYLEFDGVIEPAKTRSAIIQALL
ncbi:MAG: acetyl-CoA carboxylase carboxyltransferase component [Paracoccaceae bacterium]|jgi:acetyl-CoA carboxylase carboxyltransferase component